MAATRGGRGFAEAGRGLPRWTHAALHALLIVLSAVFLIPLFWLVGSSLKTDDQIKAFPPEWIPSIPFYAPASPYVQLSAYPPPARPAACPEGQWARLQAPLGDLVTEAIRDLRVGSRALTAAEQIAARRGVWHELPAALPAETYGAGDERVLAEAGKTAGVARDKAWRKLYHELAVGAVTVQCT